MVFFFQKGVNGKQKQQKIKENKKNQNIYDHIYTYNQRSTRKSIKFDQ